MSHLDKNEPTLPIRSPDLQSEKTANIGLIAISPVQRTADFGRWRREWDSNPRYSFPHTRFPSVRLKPLGHLSGCPLLKRWAGFCKRVARGSGRICVKPLRLRHIS